MLPGGQQKQGELQFALEVVPVAQSLGRSIRDTGRTGHVLMIALSARAQSVQGQVSTPGLPTESLALGLMTMEHEQTMLSSVNRVTWEVTVFIRS
jgi:hypothetical protein